MNNKLIVKAVNTPKRYGDTARERNTHCWAELIALYEDGTWEVLFEYRWPHCDGKMFNTGRITNKTRAEAMVKLEQDYYAGKLEGIFKV